VVDLPEKTGVGTGITTQRRTTNHQAVIEDPARLIDHSVGLLAIVPRGATPFEEMVLWLTDDDRSGTRGRPEDSELAVLSHSQVLQTVTIYMPGARRRQLATADRRSADFCNAWRADPPVSSPWCSPAASPR